MQIDDKLLNELRVNWAPNLPKEIAKLLDTLKYWTENLQAIESSLQTSHKKDPLLEAEGLLYLSTFEELLNCVEQHLCGEDSTPAGPIENLAALKFLFEKVAALERKTKPQWDKLDSKLTDHENGRLPKQTLKPRLDMMFDQKPTKDAEDDDEQTGLYKPPKAFAVPYTKDKAAKKAHASENKEKEIQRLRQSEFVKAITADLLPTPVEYGDGEEELDPESRKVLKKYKSEIAYEREHGSKVKRKKGEEKRYKELRTKQGMSRVGSELTDFSGFIDRLNKSA